MSAASAAETLLAGLREPAADGARIRRPTAPSRRVLNGRQRRQAPRRCHHRPRQRALDLATRLVASARFSAATRLVDEIAGPGYRPSAAEVCRTAVKGERRHLRE